MKKIYLQSQMTSNLKDQLGPNIQNTNECCRETKTQDSLRLSVSTFACEGDGHVPVATSAFLNLRGEQHGYQTCKPS